MDEKKRHIDEVFKEGLKGPEIPFEEMDWTAMEQMLHAKKKKRAVIWFSTIGSAAALLIFFILVWPLGIERHANPQLSKEQAPSQEELRHAAPDHEDERNTTSPEAKRWADRRSVSTIKKAQPTGKMPILRVNEKRELLPPVVSTAQGTLRYKPLQKTLRLQNLLKEEITLALSSPAVAAKKEQRASSIPLNRKPYLSILAAPDLTSIQGSGMQALSPNIGAMVSFPLTPKWSISGGIIYARKNYDAPFSFYRPRSDYVWTVKPNQVDATCDVLDIPIEINYEILSRKSTSVKLSGGLSSYFMLREQYHFIYDGSSSYNAGYPPTFYEIRGQNQHILGIGNLAVSLEQKMNEKISIGIKPFLKLPLTGIGYGRSKLESKGIAVSVNFRLGK